MALVATEVWLVCGNLFVALDVYIHLFRLFWRSLNRSVPHVSFNKTSSAFIPIHGPVAEPGKSDKRWDIARIHRKITRELKL